MHHMRPHTDRGHLKMSLARFQRSLLPGDVLLLATGSEIGALVRRVDASPVNHCGIYVGDGKFLHTTWPVQGSCVTRSLLIDEVKQMKISRIDVRRVAASEQSAVVAAAEKYEARGADYAFNDLLMLSAIGELAARHGATGQLVNEQLLSTTEWEAILQIHFGVVGEESLTCSEFVQRCLPLLYQAGIQLQRPRATPLPSVVDESQLWQFLDAEKQLHHAKFDDYRWVYGSVVMFAHNREQQAFTSTGDVADVVVSWAVSAGLWAAADRTSDVRLSLERLQWCIAEVQQRGAANIVAELVSPADFLVAGEIFEPGPATWYAESQ